MSSMTYLVRTAILIVILECFSMMALGSPSACLDFYVPRRFHEKNYIHVSKNRLDEPSYRRRVLELFNRYGLSSTLPDGQYGPRLISQGADPSTPATLILPNGQHVVGIGLTNQKIVMTTSLFELTRGQIAEKTNHIHITEVKLTNENGKMFGVRPENDDAWDLKFGFFQTAQGPYIKRQDGSLPFYLVAGAMDSQFPKDGLNPNFNGYPGPFEKNNTRQGRIFSGEWEIDPSNPFGFSPRGTWPRSLMNYRSPLKEKGETWVVQENGKIVFAHSYGISFSKLGVNDYYFTREGNIEMFSEQVMPFSPQDRDDILTRPLRTGIYRTLFTPDLQTVLSSKLELTPGPAPYKNKFFPKATRADGSGLIEGPHAYKFFEHSDGRLQIITDLNTLNALRAQGTNIESLIVGSMGQWSENYGVFVAHAKTETSRHQIILSKNGDIQDPFEILHKAFLQMGRPMMFNDENGQAYVMLHGTPRFEIPDGMSVPPQDIRKLFVFPVNLVRKQNRIGFEIIDDTGFIQALAKIQ